MGPLGYTLMHQHSKDIAARLYLASLKKICHKERQVLKAHPYKAFKTLLRLKHWRARLSDFHLAM